MELMLEGKILTPIITKKTVFELEKCRAAIIQPKRRFITKSHKERRIYQFSFTGYLGRIRLTYRCKTVKDAKVKLKDLLTIENIGRFWSEGSKPNGDGKNTLFNLLTGFLKPERGSVILFNGKDITGWPTFKIAKLGIARTFQLVRPFKMLDVLQNIMVPHIPKNLFSKSSTLRNRATWSLITVDLADKKNYHAFIFPHGDLKRLDLARSMVTQPRILLLDEPFAGLSHEEAFRVQRLIRDSCEKCMTIVIVEHKLKILMKLVEKILVLHQGRLIGEGSPKDVANNQEVITANLGTEAKEYV